MNDRTQYINTWGFLARLMDEPEEGLEYYGGEFDICKCCPPFYRFKRTGGLLGLALP